MNTLDELRKMAERILLDHPRDLSADEWGGNFRKLLEELSIYQIELEHQNRELEHSEKLLAEAHEEYVKLFESTPVGYVILDEERNIVKVNQTFVSAFVSSSMESKQLEGQCFDKFVTPEFRNAFGVFCKMAQTKKTSIPMELKLFDRHSSSRYVMLTARSYDMEKKRIAMAASDISMQKVMEEQLARAKNEEANANRQKSRFLTNVSHELRSPLASIVGYKEIVNASDISNEDKIGYCKEMISTCEMLQHFSDRILDVSALENGTTPIRCQAVDMEKLCYNAVPAFIRNLNRKNVQLSVQASNVPILWSDPLRLNQIINSVLEHVSNNVIEGEIVLNCTYVAGYDTFGTLHLTFSGNEIFSSENDFIRQSDFALGGAARDSVNMFITKRIVNAMKGLMIWEHPLNILRIDIPVALSPKANIDKADDASDSSDSSASKVRTCLLVDDVEMNLKILGAMMKKLGFIPTLATSGTEARELIKDHCYDVVLTDLWMPGINGEDLAIVLRQNPDYDHVPIYAVTADVEFNSNFDMDFFTDTIIKPVSLEKLQKTILANQEEKQE